MKRVVIVLSFVMVLAAVLNVSVGAIDVQRSLSEFPPPSVLSLDGVLPPDGGYTDAVHDETDGDEQDETDGDEQDETDGDEQNVTDGDEQDVTDGDEQDVTDGDEQDVTDGDGLEVDGVEVVDGEEVEQISAEDVRLIRLYMEVGLFLYVPFLLAVVAIILLCVWFYRTFLR